jgi:predicted adenine nucleotide alpha hydrolase (AANH) superfamily ATPase
MNNVIAHDKQKNYNNIKGEIVEINTNPESPYWSVTFSLGHDKKRVLNLSNKSSIVQQILEGSKAKIGDRVTALFFVSSSFKNDKYYTTANLLGIEVEF